MLTYALLGLVSRASLPVTLSGQEDAEEDGLDERGRLGYALPLTRACPRCHPFKTVRRARWRHCPCPAS
jgi:hypothetical protein